MAIFEAYALLSQVRHEEADEGMGTEVPTGRRGAVQVCFRGAKSLAVWGQWGRMLQRLPAPFKRDEMSQMPANECNRDSTTRDRALEACAAASVPVKGE